MGQVLKPPRSNGSPRPPESCRGRPAADGIDPQESTGGKDSDGTLLDVDKNRHTCGSSGADPKASGSLAPYGTNAASIAGGRGGVQKHRGSGEVGQEAAMGDLSTPVTSAGAGDVGAEHDATPLQSRPPRDASGRGGNFTLASLLGGGGGGGVGTETASEAATSASGMEEGSSNGEGRDGMKRKDTITWESFLANISVSDGAKDEGGPKAAGLEAGCSASDSSSPAQIRLPHDAAPGEGSLGVSELLRFRVCRCNMRQKGVAPLASSGHGRWLCPSLFPCAVDYLLPLFNTAYVYVQHTTASSPWCF